MSAIALFVSVAIGTAVATTMDQEYDLDGLASLSDRVVLGEVLTTRHEMVPGKGLYTVASIYVDEMLRGAPEPVIEVRYPGGRLDDLELTVVGAPKLIAGYDVLLFLDDDKVVGFGQGAFVIENGQAWRATDDMAFLKPSADHDWLEDESVHDDYVSYALEDVRRAVR